MEVVVEGAFALWVRERGRRAGERENEAGACGKAWR